MPIPFSFDFKNPDYISVFDWRNERLKRIRADTTGQTLAALKVYYRDNPAQFITDWGMTSDPRNVESDLPTNIPFILYPRQEEWINWSLDRWKNKEPAITVKSRDMGVTWLMVGLAVTLCLFYHGFRVGFGSRKEEYVDKIGDPDCIFYKVREFTAGLPKEFRGSWNEKKHAPYMKILYPDTNSVIKGEGGRSLGRGGRQSIYFVDEAAWLPDPESVEASLSQTTNSRQDVSTPNGMGNPFARKFFAAKIPNFEFDWRDDPRKDAEWYARTAAFLDDPVLVAQELDRDFRASLEGVLIPAAWVDAALDAHIKLGITPSGGRWLGLDIADEGIDKNAVIGAHGILVEYADQWSGKSSDIYATVFKTTNICDEQGYDTVGYDADGLGAGARGDARIINERRVAAGIHPIIFNPYHGSGAVINPTHEVFKRAIGDLREKIKSRTNLDYFENYKAQAWFHVRKLFMMTYRAVVEKQEYNPEQIISISSKFILHRQLMTEISQPTCSFSQNNKMLIDKKPLGARSPNLADALVVRFAPKEQKRGFMYD